MGRRLRILHIGNGRAHKIKAIVDAFLARGHDLHVVPIPAVGEPWPGVTWHRLATPPVPSAAVVPARMLQVRRLAKRLNPDVVHAHNAWGPGWYGAVTGRHPLVIHAYGGDLLPERYQSKPALERRLTSWACRTADRIIVTGSHMVGASAGLAVPQDRIKVLPRGVDLQRFRPGLDAMPLRQQLAIDDGAPVVFSPRYQVHEALYNLDVVIAAFATVREEFPRAVCLQMFDASRPDATARLADMAGARGLGNSYRLVPAVDNASMPAFYGLADVVVSVPSTDGFPVTVLEASACGVPLVVSRLPYCDEWFVDGENGLIVPVGDAGALAAAVTRLFRDGDLRQRLGRAGRRLVEERADYQHCMAELERDYFALIDATRPS
jgi:L-malate glycosyltransferase